MQKAFGIGNLQYEIRIARKIYNKDTMTNTSYYHFKCKFLALTYLCKYSSQITYFWHISWQLYPQLEYKVLQSPTVGHPYQK